MPKKSKKRARQAKRRAERREDRRPEVPAPTAAERLLGRIHREAQDRREGQARLAVLRTNELERRAALVRARGKDEEKA